MTRDARKLLGVLKSTQGSEDAFVSINYVDCHVSRFGAPGCPVVDLTDFNRRLKSVVDYLQDRGLIEASGQNKNRIRVSHKGWHYRAIRRKEVILIFLRSVLAPVVVSILTNLVLFLIDSIR